MGCVHMHRKILAIEGWSNSSCVWNTMKKIGEYNQKAKKIGQIVNQAITFESKHYKIWTWWALNIMSKNMLEKNLMVEMLQDGILKLNHFVVRWVIQMEENMHELGIIKGCMLLWNVVEKGRCYCQLELRF